MSMGSVLYRLINRGEHGTGFLETLPSDLEGLGRKRRLVQKCLTPLRLVKPIGAMRGGDGEVQTPRAS
jgi:hypothetical protein